MSTGVSKKVAVIGFKIEVVVEPDDSGFHAYCPALKGLHTSGTTEKEALDNARDAAIAYLESLIKHGDPIPVGMVVRHEKEGYSVPTERAVYHTEDLKVACAIS